MRRNSECLIFFPIWSRRLVPCMAVPLYLPIGSIAITGFELRLGLPVPLEFIAVTLYSYSRLSINPVDLYLVIVTGFLLMRTHLSDLVSLRSMMYPATVDPPSSSGGFQVSVIPSWDTSNISGVLGAPGTAVEGNRT